MTNAIVDDFVSPRTIQWLYGLVVNNGIEVTIKPSQNYSDMVDVTISKTSMLKGGGEVTYKATVRDFLDTKNPFVNQHNLVATIVNQVKKWEGESVDRSAEIEEMVKREHS